MYIATEPRSLQEQIIPGTLRNVARVTTLSSRVSDHEDIIERQMLGF